MVFVKADLRHAKWYMPVVKTDLRQVKCYMAFVKTDSRTGCQVLDFMGRESCRCCKAAESTLRVHQRKPTGIGRGYGKLGRGPRLPGGFAWERPLPKSTALGQMAATARRVGAQSASALSEEAKATWMQSLQLSPCKNGFT